MVQLVPQGPPVLSTTVMWGGYHPCHMSSLLPAFNLKASYKIENTLVYEIKYQNFSKNGASDFCKWLKIMDWCLYSSEDARTELIQVLIMAWWLWWLM